MISASLGLCLVAQEPVKAACTFDQAQELLAKGLASEEVVELCNSLSEDFGGPPPLAQEGGGQEYVIPADFSLGLMEPELGDDGTWNKYIFDDAYVVQNKRDPTAYLVLLSTEPMQSGWGSLSVEVRFHHEVIEGAYEGPALVYTNDPKGETVMVFNFLKDGTVNLYKLHKDDLTLLKSKQSPDFSIKPREYQTYSLVEGKDKIELVVNGKATGLEAPYDGKPTTFGLATFGIGSYEFRNFVKKAS